MRIQLGVVFGFDPSGVRIQMAQCLDLTSAMLGFAALGKQMLQRTPGKAIELSNACGILEIHRIRNGAVFGLDWRGVRIRLARCLDSQPLTTKCVSELPVRAHEFRKARGILEILRVRLGAVFGFDWHGVRIRVA